MVTIRHSGRWTLEDRFASPWQYLPVEVPDGAWGLQAELEYERSGAVLDLGCIGPGGVRGWSGWARRAVVITPDAPGPRHLTGLHGVPRPGAESRLPAQVASTPGELTPGQPRDPLPPLADRPPRRELPASAGRRWLAGDLHTHTLHSDGAMTVPELACFAVERGLDFIAVTDHNTISHHAELPAAARRYGIALLPGQEVTTAHGHAGVLGDTGWIDFRRGPDDWLDAAERGGGLMSVNHPIAGPVSWLHQMRRLPPLVEVWHWSWLDLRWTTPLAWWQAWDPAAVPVGGSHWRRPGVDAPAGTPTIREEA